MLKIVLLASGNLGLIVLKKLFREQGLQAVFTNKKSTAIVDFCVVNNIPYFADNPRGGKATGFIKSIQADVLLSVNYLFIVEEDIINIPSLYAINFHGSLLPKYRGRTPHVWAIINGEKEAGITAHLMDAKVDNGDIVQQIIIPIEENDTGAMILEKYNRQYPIMLEYILKNIQNGTLTTTVQDHSKATYFGKRTSDDGRIDWNWSKERIRNWIRAQAAPYPGAFCYYKNHKITIHKATFSYFGFHADMQNGTIISVEDLRLVVKTPNGCLCLEQLEKEDILIQKNDVLS